MGDISGTLAVGPYEVYLFFDGIYSSAISDLAHPTAAGRDGAIENWGKPTFDIDVNCFGIHGPDGLVLVDAGTGEHWGPAYGKAAASMLEAGFEAEQVSMVLLTHIHGDHALGLLDGEKARFPNAEVRLPRGDADYYGNPGRFEKPPEGCRTFDRLKQAYGVQLVPLDPGPVIAGIDSIALPGHTPGHSGYLVHDDRRKLLLWGDVVHIDALQLADPLLGMAYDVDQEQARHSRLFALETAAREGWHIGGGHVKGIRQLEHRGGGFAFR